ncbi:BTAD domain-containing putative transcriptional regulator [Streptosporangium canum]|uniref:AfsR/SARP family transcriptional regulator n=1 Tax=Streptosporangium canum TaxID=324952 RepID=UPI0036B2DAE8
MEFRIMGALEVRDGAEDRTPTAPKHRDLLAMFVLNARRPLTVGRLRALLWPREDEERSDSLVRGYVGQLRRLIGKDVITTVSGTYTLAIEEDQLDVDRFRRLVARGSREDLQEALALWRGPVLEDVDPDVGRWVETGLLREELQELRLLALERRVGYELDAGGHREILAELRRLVARHPLWQGFRGQYMLALYRSGRRVDALNTYSALRDELDDGHAIEPDAELQLLYHRMLHDDVSLHVSAGSPTRPACPSACSGMTTPATSSPGSSGRGGRTGPRRHGSCACAAACPSRCASPGPSSPPAPPGRSTTWWACWRTNTGGSTGCVWVTRPSEGCSASVTTAFLSRPDARCAGSARRRRPTSPTGWPWSSATTRRRWWRRACWRHT